MIVGDFTLTVEQLRKISDWMQAENREALRLQQKTDPSLNYPYTGAIGGNLTYHFTPTNLGTVVKVEHGLTGRILDVTDYNYW